jgi:hypothetical protein
VVAVRWLDDRFEPIMERIPISLFAKLEPAEIFHQLLEHRWFLSEQSGTHVALADAVETYVEDVLKRAPDEVRQLAHHTGSDDSGSPGAAPSAP